MWYKTAFLPVLGSPCGRHTLQRPTIIVVVVGFVPKRRMRLSIVATLALAVVAATMSVDAAAAPPPPPIFGPVMYAPFDQTITIFGVCVCVCVCGIL
jgi:hypothetical protein